MVVRLVYETHSISVDNEAGIATGRLPGELSEVGKRLAVEMGRRWRGVDVVYASDLRRAVQTVEIAFGASKEILLGSRVSGLGSRDSLGLQIILARAGLAGGTWCGRPAHFLGWGVGCGARSGW